MTNFPSHKILWVNAKRDRLFPGPAAATLQQMEPLKKVVELTKLRDDRVTDGEVGQKFSNRLDFRFR